MKKHRNKLILAAFALQILMLLGIVGAVYAVSLNGRTAVVEMTGYDPYDALRGRYLHLRNPDSDIPLEPGSVERYEALPWDNNDVYVILETDPDSGLERFSYATLDRPGRDVAEFETGKETHAWFTGFAPAEAPKIVVTVVVEEAGSGGREAAPIARQLFDLYMSR